MLYRSSLKAGKQWMYGFVVFVRAREMGWTPGRCQGFKYTAGGAREKCCAAGGDVILEQHCTPEESTAGQNTSCWRVFTEGFYWQSLVCVCKVRQNQIPNKADNFLKQEVAGGGGSPLCDTKQELGGGLGFFSLGK